MFSASEAYSQVMDPFTNKSLPNPYRTLRNWAELPSGMTWPAITGIMESPDGLLYVLGRCHENSCAGRTEPAVLVYNSAGKIVSTWGSGLFNFPHGFLFDNDGNIWISDSQAGGGKGNQVFKFTRDGKLLMTLGKAGETGSGPDVFDQPTSIAIAPGSGEIFVSEGHTPTYGNSRIMKFSKDGKLLKIIGKKGRHPGEFMGPHCLTFDSRGRLFVADRGNNRIQILDQEGRFLVEWRQFGRPSGLFIAKDDTLYVANSESWGPDQPGWKKGIRIGSAKDGSVSAFIEDLESTTEDHSGAEAVGVDAKGNVYGGVVRRKMLEKHVPAKQ